MHSHRELPQEVGSFTLALVSDSCGGRYKRCLDTRGDACPSQEVSGTVGYGGLGVSFSFWRWGGQDRPCDWEAWNQKDLGSDSSTITL